MSDNIKAVQFRPEVNEDLVRYLEETLEEAKRGDMTTGYFFGYTRAGEMVTIVAPSEDRHRDLAGAARIMHRIQLTLDAASRND